MKLKRTKLKWKNENVKVASLKGFCSKYRGTSGTIKMDYCSFGVEGVLRFIKFKVECITMFSLLLANGKEENGDKARLSVC